MANIVYKPYKGVRLGLLDGTRNREGGGRILSFGKDCILGTTSGVLSVCGIPSGVFLCGQVTANGFLNQITYVPMVSLVSFSRMTRNATST